MCALVCSTFVYLYSHTSWVLHVNVYSFYTYTVCMRESMRAILYICLCMCVHVHVSGHADNCVGHMCICECAHVCLHALTHVHAAYSFSTAFVAVAAPCVCP